MSMDKKTPPLRVFSIPYGGTARKCAMIERRKQEGWAWKKRLHAVPPALRGKQDNGQRPMAAWGARLRVARAALHTGEEPCLCGERGAGAVFFSGCALHCVFCQNAEISQRGFGKEIGTAQLAEIFLRLQDEGAQTLDLVSPTHFAPQIARALERPSPGCASRWCTIPTAMTARRRWG